MDAVNYLDQEIERLRNLMVTLEPTTDDYGTVESRWRELVNQKLEFEKHKADCKDRVGRHITDNCKWAIPLGVSVVMTLLAYTFEAKGVIPCGVGKKWADKVTKY